MRFVLLALVSTLTFSACDKKSSHKDSSDQSTPTKVGYPDLSSSDEFLLSSTVSVEKSCYDHEWKRMVLPKGIDIHDGSDLVKSSVYVEVSLEGCLALIPLQFEANSNLANFKFTSAIMKEACPAYKGADYLDVPFRYLQLTENGKRGFMFQLDEREQYCDADLEDGFQFTEP